MARQATINRKTKETDVKLKLNLDGSGKADIQTGIPFLDHMLDLFTKHGGFDLTLKVKGDIEVDFHHTTEDIGICLGLALKEALGDYKGISRYAFELLPMDESLVQVALDISNRACLMFSADFPKSKVGTFDVELVEEFFHAFANNARLTLHVDVLRGTNLHHMIEACFKGLARALKKAVYKDPKNKQIPSTKGVL